MELLVDAVFMNAGSRVTIPVFARSCWMSIACSFSLPTTIGASRTAVPALISAFSLTGGLQGASGNQTLALPATGKIGPARPRCHPRAGHHHLDVAVVGRIPAAGRRHAP